MGGVVRKAAVLYHYPCPDGAFAALAAHLYFSTLSLPVVFYPNTVYNPIRAEDLPSDELNDVYLLDFVGHSGFVADISPRVESVIILDHHKTAFEALCENASSDKNVTKIIDMERSGATIAFDYFKDKLLARSNASINHGAFGNEGAGATCMPGSQIERLHRLFRYIEDGDLWRWMLPDSKAFSSGLKDMNIEYNFNNNSALFDQLLSLDPELVIVQGKETLSHKQLLIEEVLKKSYEVALGGGHFGHCLAVDADSISNLRSELGHQLANKSHNLNLRGIGAVVYKVPELSNNEKLKISLRSLDSEDTTPISKEFGGGGHRGASSFSLSSAEFEKWKVRSKNSSNWPIVIGV